MAGLGFVGISSALLLSQNNEVVGLDIDENKINLLNNKTSPIEDKEISDFLSRKNINFCATLDERKAFLNADFVIISTPTNFNEESLCSDTKSIESVVEKVLGFNDKAIIIIKSTVPLGYTEGLKKRFKTHNIIFSRVFARGEGSL